MKRKKENNQAAPTAEEIRASVIQNFNANNDGNYQIDPEKTPTEDDIKAAKEDFETRVAELNKKVYLVADQDNALRVAKFLDDFISNGFWSGRFFVGVINFKDYIANFIKECEETPKALEMDYNPLQFCQLMLENYAGFGYESAKKMADIYNEYVPIYDTIKDSIEWYKEETTYIDSLKQRWALMEQGYYLNILKPAHQFDAPTETDGEGEKWVKEQEEKKDSE